MQTDDSMESLLVLLWVEPHAVAGVAQVQLDCARAHAVEFMRLHGGAAGGAGR